MQARYSSIIPKVSCRSERVSRAVVTAMVGVLVAACVYLAATSHLRSIRRSGAGAGVHNIVPNRKWHPAVVDSHKNDAVTTTAFSDSMSRIKEGSLSTAASMQLDGTELTGSTDNISECRLPAGTTALIRVGFIDEQMGSGLKALLALLQFARATGATLVEPAAGSDAANSNFHTTCPTDSKIAAFQALGAVYSLPRLASAGFRILPLTTFWRLEQCGALPPRVVLPGSWDSNGTCFTCEGDEGNITVFRHENANRIHAGNRVRITLFFSCADKVHHVYGVPLILRTSLES